jgi:hypothetical protein
LFVIFAPKAVGDAVRERALVLTAARVREFAGGVESFRA